MRSVTLTFDTPQNGVLCVSVTGDIDAANAQDVRDSVSAKLTTSFAALIFDLGNVQYIDSAGVRMLIELRHRLEGRSVPMLIVRTPRSSTAKLLDIVGLTAAGCVYDDVAAACAGAPGSSR